jgi:hypothetical protein
MSSPDVRELMGGEELDPLKRQSSLSDPVFEDTPSFAGSMLEKGYMSPCHKVLLIFSRLNRIPFYNIELHFFPMQQRGRKNGLTAIEKAANRLEMKGALRDGCQ